MAFMKAVVGNEEADRHYKKYLTPQTEKLLIGKDHDPIPINTEVEYRSKKVIDGRYHAVVLFKGKQVAVPLSKVVKPKQKENAGLKYEQEFVELLKANGLMDKTAVGAGSTAGNDFSISKKSKVFQGEVKESLKADFGQLTLQYDHKRRRWEISPAAKKRRPLYAKKIESATIDGIPLLEYVSKHVGAPVKGQITRANFYSDEVDLSPIQAYLKDHHVDLLHIGSHGTFRAGLSHTRDRTGLGLSILKGSGKFRVRGKHTSGNVLIAFNPNKLSKSDLDIYNNELHMKEFKRRLRGR